MGRCGRRGAAAAFLHLFFDSMKTKFLVGLTLAASVSAAAAVEIPQGASPQVSLGGTLYGKHCVVCQQASGPLKI